MKALRATGAPTMCTIAKNPSLNQMRPIILIRGKKAIAFSTLLTHAEFLVELAITPV
jgi:hypothetical protein